jgi:excisionase family DNA binding protein
MAKREEGREISQSKKPGRPVKPPRQILALDGRPPVACSMREAAKLIGIGVTKLYSLVTDGSIASFCIGSRRLIAYESLLAFCRAQVAGQQPASAHVAGKDSGSGQRAAV